MDIAYLLQEYAESHYTPQDFIESPEKCSKREVADAHHEYLADPPSALLENVERCKLDLAATVRRFAQARADGLFDLILYKTADEDQQAAWRKCMDIVRGDHQRAVSELRHWRDYANLAIAKQLPMPNGAGLEELANAKAFKDDRQDDHATNAARNKVAADLAAWEAKRLGEKPDQDDEVAF